MPSWPGPWPGRVAVRTHTASAARESQRRAPEDETWLSKRDQDDEKLVEAMRRNTEATIGDLATAVGKSRSSIVSALHRLRDAGLAQSAEGKWKFTESGVEMDRAVICFATGARGRLMRLFDQAKHRALPGRAERVAEHLRRIHL